MVIPNSQTNLTVRKNCRLCGSSELEVAFSLTSTPPANAFVTKDKLDKPQETYPLDVYFCHNCKHVQLVHVVDPKVLFENYVYVSGTSSVFVDHFERFASSAMDRFKVTSKDLVFEFGSNDGTLLKAFKSKGTRVLGMDPAISIAKKATEDGVPTEACFFTKEKAKELIEEHGQAKLVCANNVFAHIDDLSEVTRSVKKTLKPDGVFVFEVSYLSDVIEKTLFDTIYHEHLSYHSLISLQPFFEKFEMKLFDVERISAHGGSIRCYVKHSECEIYSETKRLNELLADELSRGLDKIDTFKQYEAKITNLKNNLVSLLKDLKQKGSSIVGFGGPAKATTLMYHFGIDRGVIDYIVDDSHLKQGLFSPGLHIPVVPSDAIYENKPDYLLVLAWNFADSIINKHSRFKGGGGRFIVPVPELRVV